MYITDNQTTIFTVRRKPAKP